MLVSVMRIVSLEGYASSATLTHTWYCSRMGKITGMKFLRWAISENRPLMAVILCLNPNTEARVVSTWISMSMHFYKSAGIPTST